jgi:hypothetical protein
MITFHLIQGCTVGIEIVDGAVIDGHSDDWFIVIDLFLVRAIVNI